MSNASYNFKWEEAMAELHEQVHVETLPVPAGGVPEPVPPPDPLVAFQHYGQLYVRYMQIFKKLEECYDCMVHPQKRMDVLKVLKIVMARVVELKHRLVKWNPTNPDVGDPPFPWEYIDLDEILVDLKLPPSTINVPIPNYFVEDNIAEIRSRNKLIEGYMKLKHGIEKKMVEEGNKLDFDFPFSLADAIAQIQRNERGRQGRMRAVQVLQRNKRAKATGDDIGPSVKVDTTSAAKSLQRLFRGFNSRKKVVRSRDSEMVFIGMKHQNNDKIKLLEREKAKDLVKSKSDQKEYRIGYETGLVEAREMLMEEQGPEMRDEMMEERRVWFTQELAKGNFPDDVAGYYASLNKPEEGAEAVEEAPAKKAKGKGKKDDKKGGKKGKGKKKKAKDDVGIAEVPPPLMGPTAPKSQLEAVAAMATEKGTYDGKWYERDERENLKQQHDMQLCREEVFDEVEGKIREEVDKLLMIQLANLKKQIGGKKGKGGKKKKGKGKKGKKKKGKGKKGKGKGKKFSGEKLCSGMDVDQMLSELVDKLVVNHIRPHTMEELIGEFNYLGTAYNDNPDHRDPRTGHWIPQDPSEVQIRQNLTEYAILPLGEPYIKQKLEPEMNVKSILLYGPSGSGKTMLAQAIAHHTGAMFMNISPSNLEKKFEGKTGPPKFVHMLMTVARNANMAPVVIYLDEVERLFVKSKKKSTGPERFLKDLLDYKKRYLQPTDRVIIIGTTNAPHKIEEKVMKDLKNFFDKFLYVPWPGYSSRHRIWTSLIEKALGGNILPDDLDVSALARVSEGYTAGSIAYAISKTLTARRIQMMPLRDLEEAEFLNALSRCPRTQETETMNMRRFTESCTNLKKRREALQRNKAGDGGGKKGKKKKKK